MKENKMRTFIRTCYVIIALLVLLIIFHPFLLERAAEFLIVQDKLVKADTILVYAGDANGERVAQAVELYKKGYGKFLLMSGGPAIWHQTYADNMREQAKSLGVAEKDILIQDRSRSTYEDAKFSLPMLKAKKVRSVILVTSPYHMRRARRTTRRLYDKENIKVIAYPVQNSEFKVKGWWKRHDATQAVVWEYEAFIFYLIKGI
jgi:uncharacterized SAM-binding protein YcdF (DUF218 family)